MLEVVHVTKRYRRVLANDDINLTIEDGRIGVLTCTTSNITNSLSFSY